MTTLFRPRLMAAFVACVALAAPAQAQFDPFHRQAPPADIPGGAAGDPNQTAELVLRVNQLEEELRQASGRIEELENAEHRLETELQKFRQDVEYRFGDRSEGAPPAPDVAEAPQSPGEPAAPARPRKSSDAFDPDADPNAPGAPRPLGTTPPSAPLVREAPGAAAGQPLELGKAPAPESSKGPPPPSGPTIVGSGVAMLDQPREQFNAALQAFQAGQYPEAEAGFKAFLAANPSHRMSADAIFYIGETYLQRSRPREAAEQYLKVSTDYAKSARAPEGMLRLGQSLAALGNNDQACATFGEVGRRYPNASAAVKKGVERETQRDHC